MTDPYENDVTRSFWGDWCRSWLFILDPDNIIAFLVLAAMVTIVPAIGSFFLCFGMFVPFLVGGYLCAFFFSTILAAANGEDDIPTTAVRDIWDDLISPLLHFLGTCLYVLLPALFVRGIANWMGTNQLDIAITALFFLGSIFWPATVLIVAMSGFTSVWPPTVIRTALAAPVEYALLWVGTLACIVAWVGPESDVYIDFLDPLPGRLRFTIQIMGQLVMLYIAIVAMKSIGLYYHHFKQSFSWQAE